MAFEKTKSLLDKARSASAGKPGKPVYTKGLNPSLMAGAPAVTTGPVCKDSEGVSVLKAGGYVAGKFAPDQVKGMLDISRRLADVYGPHFGFSGGPNTMLVPASAEYLPTHNNGYEIPGAAAVKKDIGDMLRAGVEGADPDEMAHVRKKAFNTLSDAAGGALRPPAELGDLIDLQRTMEVFSQAGASNINLPPNGRMSWPKLTGGATAYWVGEGAAVTDSQPTTGSLTLEAKKLAVRVPLTGEVMKFSSPSAEAVVRQDMARIGSLAADSAMLEGTGGTRIKGLLTYETATSWSQGTDKLLAYTSVGSPADGNSGYPLQPEDIAAMDALLPDGVSSTGWVMRPELFAVLYNRRADAVTAADGKGAFMFDRTRKAADRPQDIWYDRPVFKSRNVSGVRTRGSGATFTYLLTGYFPDWVIGRMGVFEFMVDPYTQMSQYQTVIQAVQFIDAGARHAASFVLCDQLKQTA